MKTPYQPPITDVKLTTLLQALAEPTRLSIVQTLMQTTEHVCSGDIRVNLAKSTLSHHLKVLRESGLVRVRVEGTQRFFSIRKDEIDNRFPGLLDSILHVDSALF